VSDAANHVRRHPPNRALTWERLQRGWSLDELAKQIKLAMLAHGDGECGLTAHTVRRWESGEKRPGPTFRKHLVLVFGKPADQLGLLTAEELELRPDRGPVSTASPRERIKEGLAELLLRRMLSMLEDDRSRFRQKALLPALLAAGVTPEMAQLAVRQPGKRSGRDPKVIDAYVHMADAQRVLYWDLAPAMLVDAALAHTRLGVELLGDSGPEDARTRRLAGAVAQSALLSARLTFFDLGQPALAEQAFIIAENAVELAGDHALAAAIAAHHAFVPGFGGNEPTARGFLDAAHAHARYAGGPMLRAWLHCVTSEILARTGQVAASRDRIRQAQDSMATTGSDPGWLDFFNVDRLAGFAGNTDLLAGRHAQAARWLSQALDGVKPLAAKQRSVLLLDLAAAHAPDDPDHALELAVGACDVLETEPYVTAYQRLPGVRDALAGAGRDARLIERVRALPLPVSEQT
jgi:transcriptional regulator with XRE-family HTH domain